MSPTLLVSGHVADCAIHDVLPHDAEGVHHHTAKRTCVASIGSLLEVGTPMLARPAQPPFSHRSCRGLP